MGEPGVARVEELARSFAEHAGLEVVLVELVREPTGRVLRVLLDKPDGVTIDDCSTVAQPLSRALDAEPPIAGSFTLEVSSPGIERPLVKRVDFDRFAGQEAAVRLAKSHDGKKRFKGTLVGTDGDVVVMEVEGAQVRLPLAEIAKAHLVVES